MGIIRVSHRPLRPEDAGVLRHWVETDPDGWRCVSGTNVQLICEDAKEHAHGVRWSNELLIFEGGPVGFLSVELVQGEASAAVYIRPEARRQGVGTAGVMIAAIMAEEWGAPLLHGYVSPSNLGCVRFMDALEWQPVRIEDGMQVWERPSGYGA